MLLEVDGDLSYSNDSVHLSLLSKDIGKLSLDFDNDMIKCDQLLFLPN